jgi:hypothetical protein
MGVYEDGDEQMRVHATNIARHLMQITTLLNGTAGDLPQLQLGDLVHLGGGLDRERSIEEEEPPQPRVKLLQPLWQVATPSMRILFHDLPGLGTGPLRDATRAYVRAALHPMLGGLLYRNNSHTMDRWSPSALNELVHPLFDCLLAPLPSRQSSDFEQERSWRLFLARSILCLW